MWEAEHKKPKTFLWSSDVQMVLSIEVSNTAYGTIAFNGGRNRDTSNKLIPLSFCKAGNYIFLSLSGKSAERPQKW